MHSTIVLFPIETVKQAALVGAAWIRIPFTAIFADVLRDEKWF